MKIQRFKRSLIIVIAALVAATGCSKRTLLSDDELAVIFHDAFLANAYSTREGLRLDTLKLYEPIFQRYGYSTEDVQYTIGSFSTRKSARLSDVVEMSIKMLEAEGVALDREVAVLDTINNYAVRNTTRMIYQDSLIKVRDFSDTLALRITLENPTAGNYHINYRYLIDTTDTTPKGYRAMRWVEEWEENKKAKEGEDSLHIVKKRHNSSILSRGRASSYGTTIMVDDKSERLEILLAHPLQIKGTPHVTIKNLTIKSVLRDEQALDTLYANLLPVIIFNDELLFKK